MTKNSEGDGRALAAAPSSPQAVSPLRAAIPVADILYALARAEGALEGLMLVRPNATARDVLREVEGVRKRLCAAYANGHTAQAIEARRAETPLGGSVADESAVGNADAPKE